MSQATWQQVAPVIISIIVIVVVAVARSYSTTLAAITATMPLTIPLSLWIVYAGSGGDRATTIQYTQSLFVLMMATVLFVVAAWLAARAGWGLARIIVTGYVAWGIAIAAILGLRRLLSG